MDRIELGTPDGIEENVERIAEIFPQVITEVEDAQGKLEHAVDFDALRDLLGDVAEGTRERYQFTWPGKREAKAEARRPIYKTMIPEIGKSKDWDTTENLHIEGDNLDALKLLKETYAGKVKLIYIDPPYNTGHDFVYDDDFAKTRGEYDTESGDFDEEGGRLVQNLESNGRFHSDWCSMMYPRLLLARDLLAADGVLMISIDDNELTNLNKLCTEIFSDAAIMGAYQWHRRQNPDSRNKTGFSPDNEYVLVVFKSADSRLHGVPIDTDKYKNPDNDPRGPWASIDLSGLANASQRPNLHYDIVNPATGISYPPNPKRGWSKSPETLAKMISEGRILWPNNPDGRPREKKFLADLGSTMTASSSWLDSKRVGFTTNGTREVSALFDEKLFDFPKPVSLIEFLVDQGAADQKALVMDFFSGSASTAEAVIRLNASDGGSRRFVLVQIPESLAQNTIAVEAGFETICDLAEERIRRAGEKIRAEIDEANKQLELGADPKPYPDLGFRVLRIDSSNMKDSYLTPDETQQQSLFDYADNVKEGRSDFDLLFEVLPKFRIPYSAKIEERMLGGKKVFFVDGDRLAACFDANVGVETIEEMAKAKPWIAVMRDASMADDATQANFEELVRTYSPDTIARVI